MLAILELADTGKIAVQHVLFVTFSRTDCDIYQEAYRELFS